MAEDGPFKLFAIQNIKVERIRGESFDNHVVVFEDRKDVTEEIRLKFDPVKCAGVRTGLRIMFHDVQKENESDIGKIEAIKIFGYEGEIKPADGDKPVEPAVKPAEPLGK